MEMKRLKLMAAAIALCMPTVMTNAQNVPVETGPYNDNWENLANWECPEWFKDAKFGIWAHWGPQCEAEDGDWYARGMYYKGEGQYNYHVKTYGDPKDFGFKDVINEWKAEQWNPEELIKLYKSAGARYFMTLGQHHDNFDLWDSPYQPWNSVNMGPKRDIVDEWTKACKKYGLPIGVSMHGSHTWTWMEIAQDFDGNLTKEDGKGKWWEGYDPQDLYAQRHTPSTGYQNSGSIHSQWDWQNGASQPSEAYKQKFLNRVLQCVNKYNPDILYFDDTVLPFWGCDESVGLKILQHFYNHSANQHNGKAQVVAQGKILQPKHKKAMLWDVERGMPSRPQEDYWQTCTCIGDWHYNKFRSSYKQPEQVIDMLVDIVSKNGNLLLSIPIRGNGTIDDREVEVVKGIKEWMDINSTSIYGTRPWKNFGEGPSAENTSTLNRQGFNESNNYCDKDVRYVVRNDSVFATILRWPETKTFNFKSFGFLSQYYSGKVINVSLLGYGDVGYEQNVDGLVITFPGVKPNRIAPVFVITTDGDTANPLKLDDYINVYENKLQDTKGKAELYNTGRISQISVNEFKNAIKKAKKFRKSDVATQALAINDLNKAYMQFNENRMNKGGQPETNGASDITTRELVESKEFSRTDDTNNGKRFGTPKYWNVENFRIPQDNEGDKNGIDAYTGKNSLMLGTWDERHENTDGDLANARIYKRLTLQPGLYYFGANYNSVYNFTEGYIFASNSLDNTSNIPTSSIAYASINDASADGNFHGIYFYLNKKQDVYLGFQADMSSGGNHEFRASEVKLLYYGKTK